MPPAATPSSNPVARAARRWDSGVVLALGVSLLATIAYALVARQRSGFRGDDYIGFHGVVTQTFSDFLLTPIDVHFIPLHKLMTWSIYRLAPLDFDVAVGVMCLFHLLGVWMLYRTLVLLGASRLSAPLTALVGVNVYFAMLLLTWSAGIARLPYILLSIAAVYHYLRFRLSGSWGRLAAVAACVVSASAFFTKGLLIPGYLAAVELALLPETSWRQLTRNLGGIAVIAVAAAAYRVLGLQFISTGFESPPIKWGDQLIAMRTSAMILHQGVFGLYPNQPLTMANWLVVFAWVAILVWSVARKGFNAVVWLLALGTLLVNVLTITLSPRMVFGPLIAFVERYYFEMVFLVVLFLAILLRRPAGMDRGHERAAVIVAWCGVVLAAWASWHTYGVLLRSPRYQDWSSARSYAETLRGELADIRRTHAGTLEFAEGPLPRNVLGMAAVRVARLSNFLMVFDPAIRVSRRGPCHYVVRGDGRIIRPPDGCAT